MLSTIFIPKALDAYLKLKYITNELSESMFSMSSINVMIEGSIQSEKTLIDETMQASKKVLNYTLIVTTKLILFRKKEPKIIKSDIIY